MTNKSIEQTYLVLDEIDHIRKRTGMYAGSTSFAEDEEYIFDLESKKMVKRNLKYIPALIKVFSEILDNSIDESKRAPDTLKTIRVDINQATGVISVFDDGRGIPVKKHAQTNTYVPETVFSNLRAGSNFNDEEDQSLIGTNGVGSTICNVLSESFTIETADKSNFFKQTFSEGMRKKTEPTIKPSDKNFTRITFTPDYKFFKLQAIDQDHFDKMVKKVVDAAGCNTNVKFYINGQKLVINNFADYISYYVSDTQAVVYDDTPEWKVGFTSSSGFEQISFVNSVETYQGGTHIYYAWIQVANKLREYISKKHKIEVKPSEIQAHLKMFISCNINRPKFSSQTKENMVSPVSEYKTFWEPSDKFIKKIINSDVIQLVLDWVEAKSKAEELRKLRELNKEVVKSDPRRVEKFSDAMEPKDRHLCECYLTEGDSARKTIHEARGKNPYIGSFALKGKPLNVMDADFIKILGEAKDEGNKEIKNILKITGLKFGEKVKSIHDLRFGKLVLLSDEDLDGAHVCSLLINIFAYFWPELFDLGVIYKLRTPLVIADLGKGNRQEFFSDEDYDKWSKTAPKHIASRYKGLGKFKTPEFKRILENREKYLLKISKIEAKDQEAIELAFKGNRADDRKTWLETANYFQHYD